MSAVVEANADVAKEMFSARRGSWGGKADRDYHRFGKTPTGLTGQTEMERVRIHSDSRQQHFG